MLIARTVTELRAAVAALRGSGKSIGFVPTMGCLHEGHLALVDQARRKAKACVVSIFVNPTQFGPKEDFAQYPRPFEDDCRLCESRGVDIIFAPNADFYPSDHSTWVEESEVSQGLCGEFRPGHFRGVTTVVLKLFNACMPDVAVFGEKDFQQLAVIRRMVRDLDLPIRIIGAATLREPDGLAMSSRNRYLGPDERRAAALIPQALAAAHDCVQAGRRTAPEILAAATAVLQHAPGLKLQYLKLVDADSLQSLSEVRPSQSVLMLAVYAGTTRLIDNRRL